MRIDGLQKVLTLFFLGFLLALSACDSRTDPEDTGGKILTNDLDVWCGDRAPFSISPDARFLVFWEQAVLSSEYETFEKHQQATQNNPLFLDLDSGKQIPLLFSPKVEELLKEGFNIGKGNICWSKDSRQAYFAASLLVYSKGGKPAKVEKRLFEARPVLSADKTPVSIKLSHAKEAPCRTTPPALHEYPDLPIAIRQVSRKKTQLVLDGQIIATHHPRGVTSRKIILPDPNSFRSHYALSSDEKMLFYMTSETGALGFSRPTAGYVLDLNKKDNTLPYFLGASVYQAIWHPHQKTVYACMSGPSGSKKNVIASWDFKY